MRMVDPGEVQTSIVPADGSRALSAPWDDLRDGEGYAGGALVVTNLGLLMPTCGDRPEDADRLTLRRAPSTTNGARREAVRIAAETLGQLETWRAYPALYALLHSDVRAEVPFRAVACWYAERYGLPETPAYPGPFSVKVRHVHFGAWTWSVTGKGFPDAAEVTYRQQVGTVGKTEPVDGVEHLAFADSQWRWFFGVDPEDVTNQPTDCDLGATADQPVAGEDSITYVNHRCPAGMTRDDFDPSDCSPDPHAIRWELSGSTLDRPLTWEDVTTTGGPEYTWDLLSYGDYQVSADQLPEDAPDVVFSDDGVTPQATGYAVTLDADQPHVRFDDYVLPSDDPAAQRGSIEVDFYDCPKGMTAATLDPAECSPSTAGSHGYVLSPCPDIDLADLPGGPLFGLDDEFAIGEARYRIDDLPFGTYDVGQGNSDQGLILYAPDYPQKTDGAHVIVGTYEVTIDASAPDAVIALYQVEEGG